MQITKPIIAGTKIDLPDSPPNITLQVILATAIKIITDSPNHRLRFQKATPKAVSEIGTSNDINIFTKPQSPLKYSFSISKNCFTCSLTTSGFGNQNILVKSKNMVPKTPAQLLLYAK